jgi:DNA-binding XRE family transcriptional regulator
MQAVVKTPHIEVNIKGMIPQKLISLLKEEYGEEVIVIDNDDAKLVNVFETPWYRNIKEALTPGEVIRIYRENRAMTQTRLGELLGGIPRQHISNMENGKRPISLNTAKKVAKFFNIPIERLLT